MRDNGILRETKFCTILDCVCAEFWCYEQMCSYKMELLYYEATCECLNIHLHFASIKFQFSYKLCYIFLYTSVRILPNLSSTPFSPRQLTQSDSSRRPKLSSAWKLPSRRRTALSMKPSIGIPVLNFLFFNIMIFSIDQLYKMNRTFIFDIPYAKERPQILLELAQPSALYSSSESDFNAERPPGCLGRFIKKKRLKESRNSIVNTWLRNFAITTVGCPGMSGKSWYCGRKIQPFPR